jgi:hypothetical protein
LEEEIASESKKLVEGLSKEQKQFLRGYWVAAKNAALPDPIYEVIKRA